MSTSLLNNIAASTALLNLQNTNQSLQNVQNQISTGYKISSAADNAAYFAIATVLRSDSSALSTVSDTLNLGGSSLDVATSALSQIQTALSDIKNELLSAATPGIDRVKIQQQISQDQAQLKSIANGANFNGQNFLSVNSGAQNYNATKNFVSSFSRDASGAITVGTIAVNTATTALFDSNGTYNPALTGAITTNLLPSTTSITPPNGVTGTSAFTSSIVNGQLQITSYTQDPANTANYFANTISVANVSGTTAPIVTETVGTAQAAVNAGDTLGGAATGANAPTYSAATKTLTFQVAENDTTTAGQVQYHTFTVTNFTPSVGNGILDNVDTSTVGTYTDANGNVTSSAATGTQASIFNLNVSALTDSAADMAKLNAFQKQVDAAISNVTQAASAIGTARSRITSQSTFIASLQSSIDTGVGSMVNADLNTASTRLQALQVQQQLGVQSLAIANQSAQSILKLFQ